MTEVQQRNAAPRLTLITGVAATLGITNAVVGLFTGASLFNVISSAIVGFPCAFLAKHYKDEHQVAWSDVLVAGAEIVDDFDLALNQVDNFPDLSPEIARRLRPMTKMVLDEDAPATWITNEFWNWSTAYIGNPGSHKSVNLKHHADQLVRINGLDEIAGIFDPHYDPSEEEMLDTWLPGIPRDQIPFYKKPEEGFAAFKAFYAEFRRRMEGNLKDEGLLIFIIDEFQDAFTGGQLAKAIEWLGEIVRGGRKFGMRLFLGMHSPKKNENGLDSSVLMPMTWVLMGKTIDDTTPQWPGDIKRGAGDLIADVDAAWAADPDNRFTTAVIRPGSFSKLDFTAPTVKQLPNRAKCIKEFVFDDAPWLDRVRDKAATAIDSGEVKSFTGLCRIFKLDGSMARDKKTGKYKKDEVQVLYEEFGGFFE